MSAGEKKFQVYRLKREDDRTEVLRHRSWSFLQKFQIRVTADQYDRICESSYTWDLEPAELRRQLEKGLPARPAGERLEIGDVLAVTKDRMTAAFYVDVEMLVLLPDFFLASGSAALLTIDTTDYQIEGRPGNWLAADETWIDGEHYFLMQSQQFGKNAAYAVLDSYGRQAAQDTTQGFSEEVIRQIREYMQKQLAAGQARMQPDGRIRLENWQKSFENGEYLRSAEMAEEQNYSMIDGRMNNLPPKPVTAGPVPKARNRRRRKGGLPVKDRESVLKRLREYQEALSGQKGQPVMSQAAPELQERRKA